MSGKNPSPAELGPNDCTPTGPNGMCGQHGYPFYHCTAVVWRLRQAHPSGDVERVVRALAPLLMTYVCDAPHWDEGESGYYPALTYESIAADLASDHHGDCTHEPQPCLRCHAESVHHEATWIAPRLVAALRVAPAASGEEK